MTTFQAECQAETGRPGDALSWPNAATYDVSSISLSLHPHSIDVPMRHEQDSAPTCGVRDHRLASSRERLTD